MSYPDLKFLSFVVAYDMMVHHKAYVSSIDPNHEVLRKSSSPLCQLDYFILNGSFSDISLVDATKDQTRIPPFPVGNALRKDWFRLFTSNALRAEMPVVIILPPGRSGSSQVMTATVDPCLSDISNRQDPTQGVGIRWLHCK